MGRRELILNDYRGAIRDAARRNKAASIALVGSVARGEDDDDSDYDFLVDFLPDISLFDMAGLQVDLEELLGRGVDVVPSHCLRDSHRSLLEDAIPL